MGFALGYGSDRNDIGSNGTRSNADSLTVSGYASVRLFDATFIDGSLGYGTLGYDNRRWVSGDGVLVNGRRDGSYWFGGVAASVELRPGLMKIAPYVRADFMRASLNNYSEEGASAQLLTYQAMTVDAVSGAIGLRGSIDVPVSFGTLTPTARLEYRQTNQGAYHQTMYYSDLGSGTASTFAQVAATNHLTSGALGLRARSPGGLTAEVEYGLTGGAGSYLAQTIRAALRLPF